MNRDLIASAFAAVLFSALAMGCGISAPADHSRAPKVGNQAPDFGLNTLDGQEMRLSALCETGRVVVVQLRGWVGYQCPVCTQQVGDLLAHSDEFTKKNAKVVLIYPGPADGIDQHAREFVTAKEFPPDMFFVTDPDMKLAKDWGLRWDESGETAFPATFVIDETGKVLFAKISDNHGGRASSEEILMAL